VAIRAPREKDILRAVRQYLDLRRVLYLRNNSGALRDASNRPVRFGQPGSADLILCHNGRFVSVEVKGPAGRLSEAQLYWAGSVRAAGGVALVVRSVEELIHELALLEGS